MNGYLVWEQFYELNNVFPDLVLQFENSKYFIRGKLHFRAQYSTEDLIEDTFFVEIEIPSSYPASPPAVRDLGGRIPSSFHTFSDGTFCLGAPLAVKMTFSNNPTLLGFVNSLLIPYLYSFSFQEANQGKFPYGELEHGASGIMSYYMELFNTPQDQTIALLVILAFKKYRGHLQCPCKSGKILRQCHGPLLLELQNYHTPKEFYMDLNDCYQYFKNLIKERKYHV